MVQDSIVHWHYFLPFNFGAHPFTAGAKRLISKHQQLPSDQYYICCVEQYDLPSDNEFWLVVCMTS